MSANISFKLNDILITPYYFDERPSDSFRQFIARVTSLELSDDMLRNILKLRTAYLLRIGIDKDPIKVRIGFPVWSEENGIIKYELLFTEEEYYATKKVDTLSESVGIMSSQLEKLEISVKSLFDLIQNKGIVTKTELTILDEKIENDMISFHLAKSQVNDIDNDH